MSVLLNNMRLKKKGSSGTKRKRPAKQSKNSEILQPRPLEPKNLEQKNTETSEESSKSDTLENFSQLSLNCDPNDKVNMRSELIGNTIPNLHKEEWSVKNNPKLAGIMSNLFKYIDRELNEYIGEKMLKLMDPAADKLTLEKEISAATKIKADLRSGKIESEVLQHITPILIKERRRELEQEMINGFDQDSDDS